MDRESNYISLQDATKFCNYTQEYLSLRARQGKLKAVKFGRNWVTKEEWLKEYLGKVEEYNHKEETVVKIKLNQPPKFSLSALRPIFSLGLVFILFVANIAFGKEDLSQVFKTADYYTAKIGESSDLAFKKVWNSGKTIFAFGNIFFLLIFSLYFS